MIVLIALAMAPAAVTTVRLPRSGGRLFGAVKTPVGTDIRLLYRHSVEKTAVQGWFTIGQGPVLQLMETRMASVGSGMPNTAPSRTRRDGEWIVVDEGLLAIPGFDFFLEPINQTRLIVKGVPIPVENLPAGSVVRLNVEAISLGQWMMWRWFKTDWRKDPP
ncbi:MAG: DUF1850 domain-containing protein [Desulfobacterales bacterium]|nr:DUF1850 domain-containing protein [Desulfobacterales bacterium]